MSLRRKIALWLCPELAGPVDEPTLPFPHAQHTGSAEAWASNVEAIADQCRGNAIHAGERIIPSADNKSLCETLKASQHASDAAWKAAMHESLTAIVDIEIWAVTAFRSAEQFPKGSWSRRFVEHGAICYANAAMRMRRGQNDA